MNNHVSDHFFIIGDLAMYDTRRELWKAACVLLDERISFSIKNIWNYR